MSHQLNNVLMLCILFFINLPTQMFVHVLLPEWTWLSVPVFNIERSFLMY